MATFLDVTALESFSNIFVFLFVWLGTYGVLAYTRIIGQNQFLNILIGLLLGLFVLLSDLATRVLLNIIPWLVLSLVFIMIVSSASKAFGGSVQSGAYGGLKVLVFVIISVAIVVAIASDIRQSVLVPGDNETSTDFDRDFSQTASVIFHPNFLGMVFLLALAVFTIALLASKQT